MDVKFFENGVGLQIIPLRLGERALATLAKRRQGDALQGGVVNAKVQ